jgi:hypothetical protein
MHFTDISSLLQKIPSFTDLWLRTLKLIEVFKLVIASSKVTVVEPANKGTPVRIRVNWQGDHWCSFCNLDEYIMHIFFDCFLARYVWSLIAWVIGAECRPSSISQYWDWGMKYMPKHTNLHMVGLAVICWAISQQHLLWKEKNRSPIEIICLASSFVKYW